MIKILFVCHGNICRSPMAEFVMQHLIAQRELTEQFEIASAATSSEEIGNGIHQGTREKLTQVGIPWSSDKKARQMKQADYMAYDYLIGMDKNNIRNMKRICGEDADGKIHLLLEYTNVGDDIADPWYTGNFDQTYEDVLQGCTALLQYILNNNQKQLIP